MAFCLKTLLGGALYRSYPNDWAVWREDAGAANGPAPARALPGMFPRPPPRPPPALPGRYAAAYSGPRRPATDDIDGLLFPESEESPGGGGGASFLDGFAKFVKGFQAM